MPPLKYIAYGETHPGLVRPSNEDAFLIDQEKHLFAIADGLGGLPHGELASKTAIQTLATLSNNPNFNLKDAFFEINNQINILGESIHNDFGIATTLTAIQINCTTHTLQGAHVGDTGLLLFKKNQWTQLTHDHTLAQQIKDDAGPNTPIPQYYYQVLTQCLGKDHQINPQILHHPLEPNDHLLLYSDGLSHYLTPQELLTHSTQSPTPKTLVQSLIQEANNRGGKDNITAIAIYIT